jgi:hypothetical protein
VSLFQAALSVTILFLMPWFRTTSGLAATVGLGAGLCGVIVNRRQSRPVLLAATGVAANLAALGVLAWIASQGPAD